MKIILQNEKPLSWNEYYSGMHWSRRKAEADRIHDLVFYTIPRKERVMFTKKVNVYVTAYFKERGYDSDNIVIKIYVDALKGTIIENDSRKFVGWVGSKSMIDKENPRVEILIEED